MKRVYPTADQLLVESPTSYGLVYNFHSLSPVIGPHIPHSIVPDVRRVIRVDIGAVSVIVFMDVVGFVVVIVVMIYLSVVIHIYVVVVCPLALLLLV